MLNQEILIFIVSFFTITLAAQKIGLFFSQIKLPKITGYLFAGVLTGPFLLKFIPNEAIDHLHFVDEISLAIIAFAAGNELFLPELKGRFKSIGWVTAGLTIATLALTGTAVFLLAGQIFFMRDMGLQGRVAVALLTGAILIARSPSSAIAIVNELRAKGPYTQVALGVTVIMDMVVITVFAINASVADALLTQVGLNLGFLLLLVGELLVAIFAAFCVYKIVDFILARQMNLSGKAVMILLVGWSVFYLAGLLREVSHDILPFEILIEPLLVCTIAGFLVTNYGRFRVEFDRLLYDIGPVVYVVFFTLTGASLKLDVLASVWQIALALFAVRILSIIIGSYTGGVLAGDPADHNRLKWMGFVTQAGVALGLAKEVAGEFPEFGASLATLIIAVVVLNEMIGPIFFKFAINRLGEAHTRGEATPFDGVRDAVIFGVDNQALAVARQLMVHDWQVKFACSNQEYMSKMTVAGVEICSINQLDYPALDQLELNRADAVVAMLSDEENYRICQLVYEHFGIETMVVRLNDRANLEQFHELGALIVEPGTAMVSLLDQFVRSPTAASLFMGIEPDQDVIDLEVRDKSLDGVMLRDLRLPPDILVLAVNRDSHAIVSHGYTQLKMGDRVTFVGSNTGLEEVMRRFDARPVSNIV